MAAPSTSRALPLDALRGLSIFLMILSSSIPFHVLPDWMYHAQVPPPDHRFNPALPGITWVDLVFPFFLFSMGAAIPFALSRRVQAGMSKWRISRGLAERGLLLAAFAIYDEHIRPWRLHGGFEGIPAWIDLVGLIGFALLIPMFMQFPKTWSRNTGIALRVLGWGGAVAFMALIRYPDGSGFLLGRSDIIILVLANMAFFSGLIWMLTQSNLTLRLAILGALFALRVSSGADGWIHDLWASSPVPWLFRFDFLKYLFIVIPGTMIGDLYLQFTQKQSDHPPYSWSAGRFAAIAGLMLVIVVVAITGMKMRAVPETTIALCALLGLGLWLLRSAKSPFEQILSTFFQWSVVLTVIGLLFEPFEGGIKKDPSTLSYYFLTGGLAIATLIACMIAIDRFRWERPLHLFVASGQNPLVAYAGINNFIRPLLGLTGLGLLLDAMFPTPWLGVIKGIIVTSLVSATAVVFTKFKVFLKT